MSSKEASEVHPFILLAPILGRKRFEETLLLRSEPNSIGWRDNPNELLDS
jgi:hypothetical protein